MAPSTLGKSRASFCKCLAEATTWLEIFSKRSKKTVSLGRRLNMREAAPGLRLDSRHVKGGIVAQGLGNATGGPAAVGRDAPASVIICLHSVTGEDRSHLAASGLRTTRYY